MKALKLAACLLLAASLSSCFGSYEGGSDSSESNENQEFGDNANVNQPTTTTVAGGSANVDASNNVSADAVDPDGVVQTCAALQADGPGGFVFKPISESDGNLAILPPAEFIASKLCAKPAAPELVEGEEGEEAPETDPLSIECVEDSGTEPDEGRLVFRFSMPGGFYSSEFTAVTPQGICSFEIEDTSERVDREL